MGFTIGLSFLIHLAIVLVAFLRDFYIELRNSPKIVQAGIILACVLEGLYFAIQFVLSV